MPLYDFKCPQCEEYFTEITSMDVREVKHSCGNMAHKVIRSAPWQMIDINSDRWVNRHKKRR